MSRQNAIVGNVTDVTPKRRGGYAASAQPPPTFVDVTFADGPPTRVDMSEERAAVWVDVLDDMRRHELPVYAERDPDTGLLTALQLPMVATVVDLATTTDGDLAVLLAPSQARHVLRLANPDFGEFHDALETARRDDTRVLVTESPDHDEIIDVRPAPHPPEPVPAPGPAPDTSAYSDAPVTLARAQQLYDLVNAQDCDATTPSGPCIPFLYPRNGCWVRAHEMRRLMIENGTEPRKVWIYGGLNVATPNVHTCGVSWWYHVAPIVDVDTGSGTEVYVIDPSMFDEPVPEPVWVYAQGDPSATVVRTTSQFYFRNTDASTIDYDDDYTDTTSELVRFRDELRLETQNHGAPPHTACFVPDVYVRDNLQDEGLQPLVDGGISRSPDINHYRQQLADPATLLGSATAQDRDDLFEDVEYGQTNYVYVRVQNRGDASGDATVDVYWMQPSTLPTPASWNLIGTIPATTVDVGDFDIAGPLIWNTVPSEGHYCFVAVVAAPDDLAPAHGTISNIEDFRDFIRNNNNITWKNFDVEDHFLGGYMQFSFDIRGWPRRRYLSDLELDLSKLPQGAEVELRLLKRLTDKAELVDLVETGQTTLHTRFAATSATQSIVRNMPLEPSDCSQATISVTIPDSADDGAYEFAVLQRIEGAEVGRITRRLVVGDHPFVANRRSGEVHLANCEWVGKMSGRNKRAYRELDRALQHGFNGCHYCLIEHDTG